MFSLTCCKYEVYFSPAVLDAIKCGKGSPILVVCVCFKRPSVGAHLPGSHSLVFLAINIPNYSALTDPDCLCPGRLYMEQKNMPFKELGLRPELVRAVRDQGYDQPTPIQEQSIPQIINGRDILASAQTGTGKTAGFTLPLLHRLAENRQKNKKPHVRALILTPTRELAAQVGESVATYGKHLPLKSAIIFGGVSVNPQANVLRRGVDILIATPGRLLDHIRMKTLDLSQLEILVLDEADRMLDMGFIHDIRKIISLLPANGHGGRQNLLFSATFSREIQQLASSFLHKPVRIEVAPLNSTVDTVKQIVHPVDRIRKGELLSYLIGSERWEQVLVFTRTKHGADKLVRRLDKDGISALAIHGNKSQGARTRALSSFKDNKIQALVATDIAARGLDIDELPYVVNYELPNIPEDYVHRIGRTGRAGNNGKAVSLVCIDELNFLHSIERLTKNDITKVVIEGFAPDPTIKAEPIFRHRGQQTPRETSRRDRFKKQPARPRNSKLRSSDGRRSRFGEEESKPRKFGDEPKRRFSEGASAKPRFRDCQKPRFGDEENSKPRFKDGQKTRFSDGKKLRTFNDVPKGRPDDKPKRRFGDGQKPRHGEGQKPKSSDRSRLKSTEGAKHRFSVGLKQHSGEGAKSHRKKRPNTNRRKSFDARK